jgi:hypothetical protein
LLEVRKCATEKYATLSEAQSTDSVKDSSVFEWHKWFERDWENVEGSEKSGRPKKQTSESSLFQKNLKKCGIFFCSQEVKRSTRLIRLKYLRVYLNLCIEQGVNSCPKTFSSITMLHLTRFTTKKIWCWNGRPHNSLDFFFPQLHLALSKIKVHFEGTKFSGNRTGSRKYAVRTEDVLGQQGSVRVSNSSSIAGLSV